VALTAAESRDKSADKGSARGLIIEDAKTAMDWLESLELATEGLGDAKAKAGDGAESVVSVKSGAAAGDATPALIAEGGEAEAGLSTCDSAPVEIVEGGEAEAGASTRGSLSVGIAGGGEEALGDITLSLESSEDSTSESEASNPNSTPIFPF